MVNSASQLKDAVAKSSNTKTNLHYIQKNFTMIANLNLNENKISSPLQALLNLRRKSFKRTTSL